MEFKLQPYYVALLSSLVVPFCAQYFKTPKMSRSVKFLLVVLLSIITGFVGYLVSGYSLNDIVTAFTGTIFLSIATYELFWKKVFEDSTAKMFRWLNKTEVVPEVKAEVKPVAVKKVKRNKK